MNKEEKKRIYKTVEYRLDLLVEAKIKDLLKDIKGKRYEASGIQYKDNHFYVVLDNMPHPVRISKDLDPRSEITTLIKVRGGKGSGYEDITYDPLKKRWYCLIEADKTKIGELKPRVDAYSETFEFIESFWLDFKLKTDNKGMEGLSHLRYKGEDFILGLCEGNACKSGKKGRKPGKGRIQLFRSAEDEWEHAGTIKLPKSVQFEDYSSLDLQDRYVTVVSQQTSAVWVGRVRKDPSSLNDLWEDEGQIYLFPRNSNGQIIFCNLEGITWLKKGLFAVVSDKAKSNKQSKRCKRKDQSIHIFQLHKGK